jgi:hypothetical protein
MSEQNLTLKKEAMIKALEKSLGVVTSACRSVGISRTTHYEWLQVDPEYNQAVQSLSDLALDFAESKLHSLIQEGDTTATIFYLKTKGKQRGYIERQEVSTELKSINITIDGGSTNI